MWTQQGQNSTIYECLRFLDRHLYEKIAEFKINLKCNLETLLLLAILYLIYIRKDKGDHT